MANLKDVYSRAVSNGVLDQNVTEEEFINILKDENSRKDYWDYCNKNFPNYYSNDYDIFNGNVLSSFQEAENVQPKVSDYPAPTTEEEYQENLKKQSEDANVDVDIQPIATATQDDNKDKVDKFNEKWDKTISIAKRFAPVGATLLDAYKTLGASTLSGLSNLVGKGAMNTAAMGIDAFSGADNLRVDAMGQPTYIPMGQTEEMRNQERVTYEDQLDAANRVKEAREKGEEPNQTDLINSAFVRSADVVGDFADKMSRIGKGSKIDEDDTLISLIHDGEIGSAMKYALASTGESLPYTAAAILPGGSAAVITLDSSNKYAELADEHPNMEKWKKYASAIMSAGTEQMVERWTNPFKALKGASKEVIHKTLKEIRDIAETAVWKRMGKNIAKESAGEGLEEVATSSLQDIFNTMLDVDGTEGEGIMNQYKEYADAVKKANPDIKLNEDELKKQFVWKKVKEYSEALLMGAVSGAMISGTTNVAAKTQLEEDQKNSQRLYDAIMKTAEATPNVTAEHIANVVVNEQNANEEDLNIINQVKSNYATSLIDEEANRTADEYSQHIKNDDDNIYQVTFADGSMAEGEEAYVVAGKVVLDENGKIDPKLSDEWVGVRRIQADGTEKTSLTSIDKLDLAQPKVTVQEFKDEFVNQQKQQVIGNESATLARDMVSEGESINEGIQYTNGQQTITASRPDSKGNVTLSSPITFNDEVHQIVPQDVLDDIMRDNGFSQVQSSPSPQVQAPLMWSEMTAEQATAEVVNRNNGNKQRAKQFAERQVAVKQQALKDAENVMKDVAADDIDAFNEAQDRIDAAQAEIDKWTAVANGIDTYNVPIQETESTKVTNEPLVNSNEVVEETNDKQTIVDTASTALAELNKINTNGKISQKADKLRRRLSKIKSSSTATADDARALLGEVQELIDSSENSEAVWTAFGNAQAEQRNNSQSTLDNEDNSVSLQKFTAQEVIDRIHDGEHDATLFGGKNWEDDMRKSGAPAWLVREIRKQIKEIGLSSIDWKGFARRNGTDLRVLETIIEGIKDKSITIDNYKTELSRLGLSEQQIEQVTQEIPKRGSINNIEGFEANGRMYINKNLGQERVRTKYIHERQHILNNKRGNRVADMASVSTQKGLEDIIEKLCGLNTYNGLTIKELADEFICRAMEIAYSVDTDVELENALRRLGANEQQIQIIKEINYEQQQDNNLSRARRNSLLNDSREGSRRQDGRNSQQLSRGEMEEQGDGSSQGGTSRNSIRGDKETSGRGEVSQVNNEQRKSNDLSRARRNSVLNDNQQESGQKDGRDSESVSRRVLEQEGDGSPRSSTRGDQSGRPSEVTQDTALEESGIQVNDETGDARFSVNYRLDANQMDILAEQIAERVGVSKAKAKKWLKAETSLAALCMQEDNVAALYYFADGRYGAIKNNSDYPQGTVDFNNICRKRLDFTNIYLSLQREFQNKVFTAKDLETIRQIMIEDGLEVACGLCYVEDRRQLLGEIANEFRGFLKDRVIPEDLSATKKEVMQKVLDMVGDDTYIPTIAQLLEAGAYELRNSHPSIFEAFVVFNNSRGMQSGRLFEGYAEYKREILDWSDKKVKQVNDAGGLRIFSFSDFEAHHLIDIVQIISDAASKGVMIQGYTKVPEFARAIRNTKVKLNRSLIPLGDTGIQEVNGEKVLAYDTTEGIDVNSENFLDESNNPNVGNVLVGINDEQIRRAMEDTNVDYIIPFHTGLKKDILLQKKIGAWVNYKNSQTEKDAITGSSKTADGKKVVGVNIYTDVLQAAEKDGTPIKNRKEFVEYFLKVCKERGLVPRFEQFLARGKNGEYKYTKGYEKLLVDFKMFDKRGNILPQEPVVPIFDDAFNQQIIEDYVKGTKETKEYESTKEKIKENLQLNDYTDDLAASESQVRYSVVTDKKKIEELEASEKMIGYRNVVLNEDGTFGSPMASSLQGEGKKVKTQGFELNKWEQAEENPDLADENGKIDLVKPDGKSIRKVDYNPYIHNRPNKVNKQFKQAWERPNLVYIETEIAKTDLDEGYHAEKAKKSVGIHKWNGGKLILSRYDKPVRIVPWEEVADDWVKAFKKRGVEFDIVPPALLPILHERGVEILPPHKNMGDACVAAYEQWKAENDTPRFSISSIAEDAWTKYQYYGELKTIRDVIDYVEENMPDNDQTKSLFDAIETYKEEEFEDRQYYGMRGDLEPFADAILEELETLMNSKPRFSVTAAEDKAYADAVARGDIETAQEMLRDAAERAGYAPLGDYKDSHQAPSATVEKEDFTNIEALQEQLDNGNVDSNLFAVAQGVTAAPQDYFSPQGARWYGYGNLSGMESYSALNNAIRSINAQLREYGEVREMPKVKVYRAVPKNIKGAQLESEGQWVSPSREYAVSHGRHRFGFNQYRIIEQEVPADQLWWDANDIREWGFDDGTVNAYQNTKNNRKLYEVTYDDKGELIPLSKRFDKRKADVRFSVTAQEDAAYMDAVNRGDMETAQRMVNEAARKAMPNTKVVDENGNPLVVYKRMEGVVNEFNNDFGTFFSNKPIEDLSFGNYIGQYFLNVQNPLRLDAQGTGWSYPLWRFLADNNEVFPETNEEYEKAIKDYKLLEMAPKEIWDIVRDENIEVDFEDAGWMIKTRSLPYDGAIIKDIAEGVLADQIMDDFIALNPNQIKSADPVTYDDNGNVIPLSERFNNDKSDIRFSIIGERGAANLDQAEEATTRLDNLAVAREMESANKDAKTIKMATGWERGADGKWRYEIEDIKLKENPNIQNNGYYNFIDLKDLLDDSALLESYPRGSFAKIDEQTGEPYGMVNMSLGDIRVFFDRFIRNASYEESGKNIWMPDFYRSFIGTNKEELFRVVLSHEIQHAIQDAEGFAKGADVNEDNYERYAGEVEARNVESRLGMSAEERRETLLSETEDVAREDQLFIYDAIENANRNIRFSLSNNNQRIFVSNAERAVESIKQEKATPQQWKAMIEKQGGLKAGEEKWLGLSEWLDSKVAPAQENETMGEVARRVAKNTVTKQEILDYIAEHQIQIEEVEYAEEPYTNSQKLEDYRYEFELKMESVEFTMEPDEAAQFAFDQMVEEYGDDFAMAFEYDENYRLQPIEDVFGDEDTESAAAYFLNEGVKPINGVRTGYITKGLENNHEIALTVPAIESWNENDKVHFGDAGEGRAIAWVRFGETQMQTPREVIDHVDELKFAYTNANGQDVYAPQGSKFSKDYAVYGKLANGEMGYVLYVRNNQLSAHPTLEAALEALNAHYEANPRQVTDYGKVLVIDEVQSKRHQEGREKGYATKKDRDIKKKITKLTDQQDAIFDAMRAREEGRAGIVNFTEEETTELKRLGEEIKQLQSELSANNGIIPDAPFDKNWHELAFKRMLRYAAENGFDYVAWTTGEQQAERYNLGDVVDKIRTSEDFLDGTIKVDIDAKNTRGWTLYVTEDGTITNRGAHAQDNNWAGKPLSDVVGKPMAEKILSNKNQTIEGEGLMVGGEGMKGFYDKMLPSFVSKYTKKWGAKVQDINLPTLEKSAQTMHAVNVTQEMKDSVMEGQVMFSVRNRTKDLRMSQENGNFAEQYDDVPYINLGEDADVFNPNSGYSLEERFDDVTASIEEQGKNVDSELLFEKAGVIADYIEEINKDANHSVYVIPSNQDAYSWLKNNKVPGNLAKNVKNKLEGKNGKRICGLQYNNSIFILSNNIDSLETAKLVYAHEAQHIENKKKADLISRVLDSVSRREALDFISKFGDRDAYKDLLKKGKEGYYALADEVVAHAMTEGYKLGIEGDLAKHLRDNGITNEELINILNEEYERQKHDVSNSNRFLRGREYEFYSQGNGRRTNQDGGNLQPRSKQVGESTELATLRGGIKGTWRELARDVTDDYLRKGAKALAKEYELAVTPTNSARYSTSIPTPKPKESRKAYVKRFMEWRESQVDENAVNAYKEELKKGTKFWRTFVKKIVDRNIAIEKFQNFVLKISKSLNLEGKISINTNAFLDVPMAAGRAHSANERFKTRYQTPMTDAIKAIVKSEKLDHIDIRWNGIDGKKNGKRLTASELVGIYCQAKDVQEAIEMGLPDRGQKGFKDNLLMDGNEVSHEDVIRIVEEALVGTNLKDNLWKAVNQATLFSLIYQRRHRFISRKTFYEYKSRKYYVPERGWRERDLEDRERKYVDDKGNEGRMDSPFNTALKKAEGRSSLASDPFAYIVSIAKSTIAAVEKNRVKQKFLQFLLDNEQVSLKTKAWTIKKVYLVKVKNKDGEDIGAVATNEKPSNPDDIAGKVGNDLESLKQLAKNQKNQHAVVVVKDGEEYVVWLEDEQLANALNRNYAGIKFQNSPFGRGLKGATGYYSGQLTQYNPEFAVSNFVRDYILSQMSNFAVQDKPFEHFGRFNYNLARIMPELVTYVGAHTIGREVFLNTKKGKYMREYFALGAQTGFSYLEDVSVLRDLIDKVVNKNDIVKFASAVPKFAFMDILSALTELSELSIRMTQYITCREMGMKQREAAIEAKEITVNFDRKGELAGVFGCLWSFFNASVQGTNKIARDIKRKPLRASLTYAGFAGLLFYLGYLLTNLFQDDPEEEEFWNEYARKTNITVGEYKIPMAHFFRIFWGGGVTMALKEQGRLTKKQAAGEMIRMVLDEIIPQSPFQVQNLFEYNEKTNTYDFTLEGYERGLMPSVFMPIYDIKQNEDFLGRKISKEPYIKSEEGKYKAKKYERTESTNEKYIKMADWLSGGNPNVLAKGVDDGNPIDINGTELQYIVEGYTKQFATLVDTYNLVIKAIKEEEIQTKDIPFLRKFKKDYLNESAYKQEYWTLYNYMDQYKAQRKDVGADANPKKEAIYNDIRYSQLLKYKPNDYDTHTPQEVRELMEFNKQWRELLDED